MKNVNPTITHQEYPLVTITWSPSLVPISSSAAIARKITANGESLKKRVIAEFADDYRVHDCGDERAQ